MVDLYPSHIRARGKSLAFQFRYECAQLDKYDGRTDSSKTLTVTFPSKREGGGVMI